MRERVREENSEKEFVVEATVKMQMSLYCKKHDIDEVAKEVAREYMEGNTIKMEF